MSLTLITFFICASFLAAYTLKKGIRAVSLLFVLTCYFNYFVYKLDLPIFLSWHREVILLALFALTALQLIMERKGKHVGNVIWLFFIILLLHAISTVVNDLTAESFLLSCRVYYMYPVLFLSLSVLSSDDLYYDKLIKLIMFTAFIQAPISIIQYLIFIRADHVGGLIGESGSISLLGISFIFFGYYLYKYYSPQKVFIVSSIGMFITMIIAESKLAMLFLPMALLYNAFIEKTGIIKKTVLSFAAVVILIIVVYPLYDTVNNLKLEYGPHMQVVSNDPNLFIEKQTRHLSTRRYEDILYMNPWASGRWHPTIDRQGSAAFAIHYINESPRHLWFGYGPGEASSTTFSVGSLRYLGFYRTYFVILLLEWGVLGFSVWLCLLAHLFKINLQCLKYFWTKSEPGLWKPLCYFSNMMNFTMIPGIFYNNSIINEYIGLFFWLVNGLMFWFYNNVVNNHSITVAVKNQV